MHSFHPDNDFSAKVTLMFLHYKTHKQNNNYFLFLAFNNSELCDQFVQSS